MRKRFSKWAMPCVDTLYAPTDTSSKGVNSVKQDNVSVVEKVWLNFNLTN